MVIFVTEFVTLKKTIFSHGGISIKLFVMHLHIINECLSYKFHPYSILTRHTKVESVLRKDFGRFFQITFAMIDFLVRDGW